MVRNKQQAAFLIAAPGSNAGKTLLSLALMKALVKRGRRVQAFKSGPDYIDPMFHSRITGRASYNLDLWMSSSGHVRQVFGQQSADADVAVVEGAMGLFDGARRQEGSAAELSSLLRLPVILVVDATSTAYSVAPLLYGFRTFDPQVQIAGVIFNKVAGPSHYSFLEEAAKDAGVEPLGFLPRREELKVGSRHLGLELPWEQCEQLFERAGDLVEQHVDVERLLEITQRESAASVKGRQPGRKALKIALASDEAFCFSYPVNRDALEQLGQVQQFSPLNDLALPEADLLWLPGGYPELFAEKLQANQTMRAAIRRFVEAGKMVIAECGGLMYLSEEIIDEQGRSFQQCGVFPLAISMENKKLSLGYRRVLVQGIEMRGHEFHYSQIARNKASVMEARVFNARQREVNMPLFRVNNCVASYLHLYLGEDGKLAEFIQKIFNQQ